MTTTLYTSIATTTVADSGSACQPTSQTTPPIPSPMPASWRGETDEGPKTVMTISLAGAPGPRTGGMTQMGGRTVQEVSPLLGALSVNLAADSTAP